MKAYETDHWRFEIDDTHVGITNGEQRVDIEKREFAKALVGLGIVHSAVVKYADKEAGCVQAT